MFTIKHPENGKTTLTALSKSIITLFTLISFVAGAIYFIDDRILAATARAEEEAVKTFKMEQRVLRMEIDKKTELFELELKRRERDADIKYLEQLRCQKVLLEKELARDPNDTWTKESLEQIKTKIRQLENKLFQ